MVVAIEIKLAHEKPLNANQSKIGVKLGAARAKVSSRKKEKGDI